MLARLAENLFWAGRYIERAEDTARMVDVTYHSLLESPPAEASEAWRQLLEVLHLLEPYQERQDAIRWNDVIRFLVLDVDHPGSILASVGRARDNAHSVRELLSSELWEAINSFHLELRQRDLDRDVTQQPYELFSMVKRRCQTVAGVATETMPRDDGWRFLTLGRMLERAEMTCRLLNVRFGQLVDDAAPLSFHHWAAVLKSASAFEAYRKAYGASMEPADVVDFLLLSHDFPRSVLFCLQTAETQLGRLGPPGHDRTIRPQRLIGRTRADLEFRDVHELLADDLHRYLDSLQEQVWTVADAVADEFFRHVPDDGLQVLTTA